MGRRRLTPSLWWSPDYEPLVVDVVPVAWLSEPLVAEARRIVEELNSDWGPLDRPAS